MAFCSLWGNLVTYHLVSVTEGVPWARLAALVNLKSTVRVVTEADLVFLIVMVIVVLLDLTVRGLANQNVVEEDGSERN